MSELHIKISAILDPYSHLLYLIAKCLPQNFELLGPFATWISCCVQESRRRNNPDFNHLISQIIRPLIFIIVPLQYLIDNGPSINVWISLFVSLTSARVESETFSWICSCFLLFWNGNYTVTLGLRNSLRKTSRSWFAAQTQVRVWTPLTEAEAAPFPPLQSPSPCCSGATQPKRRLWACWPASLPSCSTRQISPMQ